jgi:hypothetical protein
MAEANFHPELKGEEKGGGIAPSIFTVEVVDTSHFTKLLSLSRLQEDDQSVHFPATLKIGW